MNKRCVCIGFFILFSITTTLQAAPPARSIKPPTTQVSKNKKKRSKPSRSTCERSCLMLNRLQNKACRHQKQVRSNRCVQQAQHQLSTCIHGVYRAAFRWCRIQKKQGFRRCRSIQKRHRHGCTLRSSPCHQKAKRFCRWMCRKRTSLRALQGCQSNCIAYRSRNCQRIQNACFGRFIKQQNSCIRYTQNQFEKCLHRIKKKDTACKKKGRKPIQLCLSSTQKQYISCMHTKRLKSKQCMQQCKKKYPSK